MQVQTYRRPGLSSQWSAVFVTPDWGGGGSRREPERFGTFRNQLNRRRFRGLPTPWQYAID